MAQVSGTTDTYDLVGVAEDIEDVIFNINPTETPFLTMAGRKTAKATLHQWQTDTLAAAAANRQIEGDDASYTTANPTTLLTNYTQISRKTMLTSRTADRIRKYGRTTEMGRLIAKYGRELKRDIEYALVTNQASSAGGSATARSSAGMESIVKNNRILPTTSGNGTTPGYSGGVWAAPTDGTASGAGSTFSETYLLQGIQAAWSAGGDPRIIMLPWGQKRQAASFSGATKFAGAYDPKAGKSELTVLGAVSVYVSDAGEHRMVLNRYMRSSTVLGIDPDYVSVAWLDPIQTEELAKTGDATKKMLVCEYTLVVENPDAHFKVQDLS